MIYKPYDYDGNKSRLVDPINNRRLTVALFKELSVTPHIPTIFSIDEWRKVYVDIADPTDYKAMKTLLGDWEHWKLIVENQTIAPIVEQWRNEVNVKLKSEGIASVRKLAASKDSAAKVLIMNEWDKTQAKRGRPSKKQEQPELHRHGADAARLGL
jgi:hypothetical protein